MMAHRNERKCTNIIKKQIKLVIWVLDETFWKGSLSKEGIHWMIL